MTILGDFEGQENNRMQKTAIASIVGCREEPSLNEPVALVVSDKHRAEKGGKRRCDSGRLKVMNGL
jgi:hypothetical protein